MSNLKEKEMKREILFRAKRVDNGEWVYGDLLTEKPTLILCKENCYEYKVHPETVCQFTGLLDKNGNKIFEGDKIIFGDEKIIQVVEWRNGQVMAKQVGTVGSYIGLGYCKWEEHAKITGNIHDK